MKQNKPLLACHCLKFNRRVEFNPQDSGLELSSWVLLNPGAVLVERVGLSLKDLGSCYHLIFLCSFGLNLLMFLLKIFASIRDIGP